MSGSVARSRARDSGQRERSAGGVAFHAFRCRHAGRVIYPLGPPLTSLSSMTTRPGRAAEDRAEPAPSSEVRAKTTPRGWICHQAHAQPSVCTKSGRRAWIWRGLAASGAVSARSQREPGHVTARRCRERERDHAAPPGPLSRTKFACIPRHPWQGVAGRRPSHHRVRLCRQHSAIDGQQHAGDVRGGIAG